MVNLPLGPAEPCRSANYELQMAVNPYSPSTATDFADLVPVGPTGPSRIGNGPSVVIALGGLCGFLVALPLMQRQNLWGLVIAVAGWVIGGLVYRQISAKWPHDPFVRRWQFAISVAAVTIPPTVTFGFFGFLGTQYPHLIILAEILGLSIVAGVFASGTRRFRPPSEIAEPDDAREPPS